MKDNKLNNALEVISLKNLEGVISDDQLIKACENYKIKSDDFRDDYDYHIHVAKSLYDHLHGIEQDLEICKAIIPGQTKIVDGIMYIYTLTPNAKTQYDWRVYNGKNRIGRKINDSKIADAKSKYVNDMFPKDLSSLKVVKSLGGSTGAKLVEDANGVQYVMKRGSNTSNEHVKSEYLANQIYGLLGVRTPDFELYDDGGESVLLSKFIPFTKMPNTSNYNDMSKNFVADALLANWDVYMNDNCLIDSAGRVVRVDNGGALNFSARGRNKTFGPEVKSFYSMQKYNPSVVANLTDEDLIKQIDEVYSKAFDVVDFLNESGEGALAATMAKRFDDLFKIKKSIIAKINANKKKILPRKLKSEKEMYRVIDEKELDEIWNSYQGNYRSKIDRFDGPNGWNILSDICKKRGFDARPLVVEEKEYWDLVSKNKHQMFRGLAPNANSSATDFENSFKYNDNCFYGTLGVHGSGIYFHVNDGDKNKDKTQTTYKNSDAYKASVNYADKNKSSYGSGNVVECLLDPNAKIANVKDIKEEILKTLGNFDKKLADSKQAEIDALKIDLKKKEDDLFNVTENTIKQVKDDMNWNEDVLVMHQIEIDNIDWGALDKDGNPEYPSFDSFVKGNVFDWVKKNGGTINEKIKDDLYSLKLPNSPKEFLFSRYRWENNAIKRKNAFAKAYNWQLEQFRDWMMAEHYNVIDNAIKEELKNLGDKVNKLKDAVRSVKDQLNTKTEELNKIKSGSVNPDASLYNGIYEYTRKGGMEAVGIYAAIKGYDAIIKDHGNGGPNSFMIVFNRSKVIVKK